MWPCAGTIQADAADDEGSPPSPPSTTTSHPPVGAVSTVASTGVSGGTLSVAGSTAATGNSSNTAASSSPCAAIAAAASARLQSCTPRLRTRLFAIELLLSLFRVLGKDPRHRSTTAREEPATRRNSAAGDALDSFSSFAAREVAGAPGTYQQSFESFTDHLEVWSGGLSAI